MHDVFLVRSVESIADLNCEAQRLIQGESTLERSSLDELHDKIIWAYVINLANIGMIQCGNGLRFTLKPFMSESATTVKLFFPFVHCINPLLRIHYERPERKTGLCRDPTERRYRGQDQAGVRLKKLTPAD